MGHFPDFGDVLGRRSALAPVGIHGGSGPDFAISPLHLLKNRPGKAKSVDKSVKNAANAKMRTEKVEFIWGLSRG
jgi:hypothetical protein